MLRKIILELRKYFVVWSFKSINKIVVMNFKSWCFESKFFVRGSLEIVSGFWMNLVMEKNIVYIDGKVSLNLCDF